MEMRRGSWDPIIGYPSPSIRILRTRTYALSISCFCWWATSAGSLYAPFTSRTRLPLAARRRASDSVRKR